MENDNTSEWTFKFPVIKKIFPKLLAEEIKSSSPEETVDILKKMFDEIEEKTGFKPVIVGDSLPINVLIPKENNELYSIKFIESHSFLGVHMTMKVNGKHHDLEMDENQTYEQHAVEIIKDVYNIDFKVENVKFEWDRTL